VLQVANGGYMVLATEQVYYNDSLVFYEPGYNIMSTLELEYEPADQIYVLVRKRNSPTSSDFDWLNISNFTITVTDPTNGASIPFETYYNDPSVSSFREEWDDTYAFVLVIDNYIEASETRARIMDLLVRDDTDNDFISCRLIVKEQDENFYYLPVSVAGIWERDVSSRAGLLGSININKKADSYLIISPFAGFKEVASGMEYDFSYPLESVFYRREISAYNNEDFDFSIVGYSHSFVNTNVSLINVPGTKKAAVLVINKYLYNDIIKESGVYYIDIGVIGVLSESTATFRVVFLV
jgi:hypothetical protein